MNQLKTSTLKSALSKAMKAVSNNRLLPITGLIGIETTDDGALHFTTYDGSNILSISIANDYYENHYAVIDANTFNALVSKITSETVTLEFNDKFLKLMTNNGSYKFDIAYEEENKMVMFPELPTPAEGATPPMTIKYADLALALSINEAAVAQTSELVSITGAYFGKKLITTNGYTACITNKDLFGKSVLLSYNTLHLIPALSKEEVKVMFIDTKILMYDNAGTIISGELMPYVNEYPADKIMEFTTMEFKDEIVVAKRDIISALERLNIFISDFDKNVLSLEIKGSELTLTSLASNAREVLKLKELNREQMVAKVDFGYLMAQVSSAKAENVTIKYGNKNAISIIEPDATHVVALVVD